MSDDEDFWLGPSDPETHFVPQEDDDETLWEVIEITAEKGKLYKVRWKGIDPSTQKPWPQSWVAKHDCTDDLVRGWKLRQGKKKLSGRESGISKKSSGSSKATSTRRSTSTAVTLGFGSVNTPAASSVSLKTGAKRKHVESTSTTTSPTSVKSDFPTASAEGDVRFNDIYESVLPPRKKRKLEVEIVNNHEHSASSAELAEVDDKDGKRKISSQVFTTDDDIDDYVESEDEPVELGPRHSKLQRQILSQPAEEREGELDDRIESLSDIDCNSPPSSPIHNQEDQGIPTPSVRAHGQAHMQQDTAEESILAVFPPQLDTFPGLARITSELDSPSKRSTRPSSSTSTGYSRPEKSVPDQTSRSKAESATATGSGSNSLTERGTTSISVAPPFPRFRGVGSPGPSTGILIPTPPRNADSDADGEEDGDRSPILSPGTKERLEEFDRAVMQIELGKEKEQRLEDGAILGKVKKSKEEGEEEKDGEMVVRNTDSANGEEDGERAPILSPGAKERLEEFDGAVVQFELGKEKELRLEDGAILGKEKKGKEEEEEEEKDGEMVVTGGGRQKQEHLWTSQTKDKPGVSPFKPLEIEKKKKTEPLFLPDESDSNINSHARLKPRAEVKSQNGKSGSKRRGKELLNKRLSPYHLSDSSGGISDSSGLSDEEEAEEINSSSTHVSSADTKHTDRKTFHDFSKTVSKTTSKPQSTNTAHGSPPLSMSIVRRSSNARSNSFVHDIISDTEGSRSQSQEADVQIPTVSHFLVPPTTPPPVNTKFDLKSRMKSKIPQPKPRPLSRTSSAAETLALGVQLSVDMDVGNDVSEKLNGEMNDVDETVKKTSNKIVNPAMTMESSGLIPKVSSRTSKSRSRSRSVSSQKSKNVKEPVLAEAEMPLAVSIHRESLQASEPADSQRESAENSPHLGAAMHLLNTKSEEISNLENQLSAERRMNEDLLQQLSALRRHITETETTNNNNTLSAAMTLEQELAGARAQLALQTVSWENERAALTLDIEAAIRSKVSAEQDRDFFREQYAIASGFVSSVRDENAELEKQIKIATDQAHSGVSLIKTTFELRTKSLEEDVRAWRRVAGFLIEKDHRTNDDIRRHAAEEPELRARCDRQESALEDLSERLSQAEMDLDEKERLFVEAEEARKECQETTVKLNLDLNEAKTKLERIGKVGIGGERLKSPPTTPEFAYRCHWRSDDSNVACEAVFYNILEFQDHTGKHLQLD